VGEGLLSGIVVRDFLDVIIDFFWLSSTGIISFTCLLIYV